MQDDLPSRYYVRVRGRVQGPFDIEQLKKLRERGKFSRANEVSSDQVIWQSASVLDEVFAMTRRQPATKADSKDEDPVTTESYISSLGPPNRSDLTAPVWHYTVGEGQQGPVTLLELRNLYLGGQIAADDLVWKEGFPDWKAACDVRELNPPSPGTAANGAVAESAEFDISTAKHAGFWWRFLAYFIDLLILSPANAIITILAALSAPFFYQLLALDPNSGADSSLVRFFISAVWFMLVISSNGIALWLYYAMMESSSRRGTLGKIACGLIVTDMSGRRISFGQASGRYFSRIITLLVPFGLGYVMCVWSIRQQCLHDKLANCLVLKSE